MRHKMAESSYHPVRNGKQNDVEKQDRNIKMEKKPSQALKWQDVEECLKSDDLEGLTKKVEGKQFEAFWRPTNAPINATLLHKAAEFGAIECMKFLLKEAAKNFDSGDHIIDRPDNDGRTPLFMAVHGLQKEAIEILLKANAHVNARNDTGCTVLHKIADELIHAEADQDRQKLCECLKIILTRPDIDLEVGREKTPLVIVATELVKQTNSEQLLFCKSLILKGASLEVCEKGVKQFLRKQFSEIIRDRHLLTERPVLSQLLECIEFGESAEKVSQLLSGRSKEETGQLVNTYWSRDPLIFLAINKRDIHTVDTLLNAGANPLQRTMSGESCLHKALVRGNPDILSSVIGKMKISKDTKIDMWSESYDLVEKIVQNHHANLIPKADVDHMKCLDIFFKNVNFNANASSTGMIKQSILHLAISYNKQEFAKLFMERGAFLGSRKKVDGKDHGTVLKALRVETLERAMDGCITSPTKTNKTTDVAEDITDPDHTLCLNYQFLVPPPEESGKNGRPERRNEVETLVEISESKVHRKLMKHPLIRSFLYAKWRKVLPLYLLNLFLYLIFVIFLTLMLYGVKDLRVKEERKVAMEKLSSVSNSTIEENLETLRNHVSIYKVFLCLFTLYILIREIFQVIYTSRSYFKDFENYLEWFLIIVVAIFCFAHSSISVDLTRHFAAWAMIIAWYEFVLLLGRAPPLSIYVTMLRHVSWNFLKLIFLYGALILAFTVSFNIILQPAVISEESASDFSNFWSTLPKSIVMATGEFDYSDLSQNFFTSQAFYATSAVLVFLVFVFLIFLVLMNVMSGLAVSDTQKVVEEAIVYSLKSRLELIHLIEEMMLVLRSPKLLSMIHIISAPNKPHLYVQINQAKSGKRIIYGNCEHSDLDNDTTDVLRSYRLQQLSEQADKEKVDPTMQCLEILKELRDMAEPNRQILRQLLQLQPSTQPPAQE